MAIEHIHITKVEHIEDLKLKIFFNDGVIKIVDFRPFLVCHPHPQYNRYNDLKKFKRFKINNGNLVWGKNWDMVFPLDQLYHGRIDIPDSLRGFYKTTEPIRHFKLLFLCALIEYTARKTKNRNRVIVNALGETKLKELYQQANAESILDLDKISEDLIQQYLIEEDYFDITDSKFDIPAHWEIAKVYKRLIIKVSQDNPKQYIRVLRTVYNSWIAEKIDDYNCAFYCDTSERIAYAYLTGKPL